jgi:WD40 repeat protein/transcriptional regulator with XRE-family HTH domain
MAEQTALSFGGLLRQLRAEAGLTQEELAEAAKLSPRSVSDLERGINRTARRDTAVLLAEALGLAGPVRELFVAAARGRAPAAEALAAVREAAGNVAAAAPGVTSSPYRGLSWFEEQDAALFFGREAATAQVMERMSRRLQGAGMLVVSGVSGAGKSSLLRAGVLPRIRAAGLASAPEAKSWPVLVLTPTRAPLDELALRMALLGGPDAMAVRRWLDADPEGFALTARHAALARPRAPAGERDGPAAQRDQPPRQCRLLLVVDQFEEVFTQCAEEGQRRAFITALHAAATTGHGPDQAPSALVALAVRADFEARCAEYQQLADAIQDRYLVTAMTERQLRLAITEPARTVGAQVNDDLVNLLLSEMHTGQPGAAGAGVLPLLSHALDQTWRSRAAVVVTVADYERTGGIEGAVASSAQRAYDRLTPAQQGAARQVFTRLTATSSQGMDTADRTTRADLTDGKSLAEAGDVEAVLEAFAAERLLTLAAGTVEISHEVLLTAWPLLRDEWLADTRADRAVRTRLHTTAAEWARHARDPSYLYSGSLLQAADGTAVRIGTDPSRHPPLSQTERDFLHASGRARRRRARRRQALIAFLTAMVLGLASVAALALRASRQAAHQRDVAVSGQLISRSELLAGTNPTLSKLLSIAAWRINPSGDARDAMLAAAALPASTVLSGHTRPVASVAFSRDGKILASGGLDATIRLWDMPTHQQIGAPLTDPSGPVYSVAFSPDGRTLASGNDDRTVRLWDVATHQQIGAPLTGPSGPVGSVEFSADGKTLAGGSADGTVRLWDVATHLQIGSPLTDTSGAGVGSVEFSPDGKTLASGNADGTVRLWDVATHQQIGAPLTGPSGPVRSVFSPDGKTLAGGSLDGTVRLWDVATRQQIGGPLTGPSGAGVLSVEFSPDGKTLVGGNADGTVRLWDVASQIGGTLTGPTEPVESVAFSSDGNTLASGSDDGTVRLWDVATRQQTGAPLTGNTGAVVWSVAFSPDGNTLASGTDDGTVRLWDVATRQQIGAPLTGPTGPVYRVTFSRDGKTLAGGSADGTVRLWDVATHQQIGAPLTGPTGPVWWVTFSRDGKTLAGGSADGTVRLWDVATRQQIGGPLNGNTVNPAAVGVVEAVAFSPDGKTLASGSDDSTVRLWDVATHQQIGAPLTGPSGRVESVAFSRDGETLAGGSDDGTVRLWDVATRQQIGAPLTGLSSSVFSVVFSPDGKTLAIGSADGTVRLRDVAYLAGIVQYLCASVGRSLTHDEWARYVPPGTVYQRVCP